MSQVSSFGTSGGGSGTVTSISAGTGITLTPNPITTTGTVALTVPVAIANGGTNATSFTNTDGVVYFDGTRLVDTAVGTAGQVLTSQGAGLPPHFTTVSASGITTIDVDGSGSVTGSTVQLYGNSGSASAGSSVNFFASSATEIDLTTTDSNFNTIIGHSAGNASISGTLNTGVGSGVLADLTSGSDNVGLGQALGNTTTGSYNTAIGQLAGTFLPSGTGAESSNILIGYNVPGIAGTSHRLQIGNATGTGNGNLSTAFIAGINGNTVSNAAMVTINTSTNQLGTATIPSTGIVTLDADSGSATGSTVTISGGTTGLTTTASSATMDLTGTLIVANGGTGATTFTSHGVLLGNGTSAVTATANGTTGQVFTATTGSAPGWANPAASSITITGDSGGGLTGNSFTFTGGATGLTFAGAGSTETLGGTVVVAHGGTAATSFTAYAPICGGTTTTGALQSASSGISNSGWVLTSTGASSLPTWQAAGGGGGVTIDGDTGSATGSTITFNAASQAGATVSFSATGSTVSLNTTDSNSNVAIGVGTSVAGGNSVAIGVVASASSTGFDVAIGQNASATGNSVSIGYGAGSGSGSNSISIGQGAIASGSTSIAIGYQLVTSAGANSITIGTNTSAGAANSITIGSGSGGTDDTITIGNNTGGGNSRSITIGNVASGGVNDCIFLGYGVSGAGSNALVIGSGTGTGSGQLNSAIICGIQGITVTGSAVLVSSSNQLGVAISSRKYKENIEDMADASSAIYQLRPVTFNYIVGEDRSQQTGLIAEEVAEVMPSLVVYDKAGDPQTVKYHDLPALLLNEIQKLRHEVDDLKRRLQ